MKYKSKSLKSIIIFAVMIVAVIFFLNYLGIGTQRSATRIGYVGNFSISSSSFVAAQSGQSCHGRVYL